MSELENRLSALAAEIDYPEAPELVAAVELRIGPRRSSHRRRRLLFALVLLLAVVAGVLAASPGARSAFLELFRLRGATVSRVERLPRAGARATLAPGRPVPLAEAQRLVDFRIRLPHVPADRSVREVLLDEGAGVVSLVWCCQPTLVLTEFRGDVTPLVQKLVPQSASVDRVEIEGRRGLWIEGGPHVVFFRARDGSFRSYPVKVEGNVLLWVDGDVTLRLEGRISRSDAIELAASLR